MVGLDLVQSLGFRDCLTFGVALCIQCVQLSVEMMEMDQATQGHAIHFMFLHNMGHINLFLGLYS